MKKPNLLFIFADQWRREAVGFMEKEPVITPNFDSFSNEAAIFEKAYSSCPLCSPNRASILTGKNPISHGVITNCKPGLENIFLKEDEVTVGDVLKSNNYRTGYIGKWHLDEPEEKEGLTPISGAKNWDAFTPPGPRRHGFDFWYSYGADDNHLSPHYWMDTPDMISIKKWSVEHETDVALDFIDKNKEENFALFLSWNPPHTPLDLIPPKYVNMYSNTKIQKRRNVILENIVDHPQTIEPFSLNEDTYLESVKKYYAAITGIDENFGRVVDYLKKNDLFENTIIIVTSDHGEMLCSHGFWSKHVWFEEAVSVPFMLSHGSKYKNKKILTPLSGIDIAPTILSLLDINIPLEMEGKDIAPSLNGEVVDNIVVSACYTGNSKVLKSLKERGLDTLSYGWRAAIDERYTYVYYSDYSAKSTPKEFLYDNKSDEFQLNSILVTDKTKYLKDYLIEWGKKYSDPCLSNI
ncbi:sulfatase [uncultured Cetobacterium sp.]|uniref:sulfatase family protein n=1 Tax=uncultured Cetobacterium sp. TaxID=527638 RepID=UPI002608CBB0|nr:sulfatase [uncultured Cetobacterium sp.]